MIEELKQRFGQEAIQTYKRIDEELELIFIDIPLKSPVSVLMTHGLSNVDLPVHDRYAGRENVELFFCLPRYWDVTEENNPNRNWPANWLVKLVEHVKEKNGWYGPGHTVQCDKDFKPLSEAMRQNHFLLVDPILLEKELRPLAVGDKEIYFLGIIPIFGEEMDYKQGKGTYKLLKKLNEKNITEKLDDFRESVMKSRFKFW